MLISSILFLLSSNAVTVRRDKSILYARIVITILTCCFSLCMNSLYSEFHAKGLGLFGGLYHTTAITHVFHIFIIIITGLILQLNGFYPRKVWTKHYSSIYKLVFCKFIYFNSFILNKMSEQFRIIEYPLIILFVVIGGVFLISSCDLISIFLSIELQSYGLYILCAVYRNSERATSGGLTYFLLGGLSSCFILLASSLLYGNSANTSFDGLYVINNISNINVDLNVNGSHDGIAPLKTSLDSLYESYYINFSLVIMSIGFLFKVSAAPFHFWSPEHWFGKSFNALSMCLRDKLPNSGKALELKVPSCSRKVACGWSNYSCMVTSLKNSEKRGGNRGSKSVTDLYLNKPQTVKEQRVNGSWCGLPYLRCTLLGYESNRSVKIPSNQVMLKRFYTNNNKIDFKNISLYSQPWFVTGFTDAEGCFTLIARKSPRSSTGWKIEANFIINLHKRDIKLLNCIK